MARGRRRAAAPAGNDAAPSLPTGLGYGERKAIEEAQGALPSPDAAPQPPSAPVSGGGAAAPVAPANVGDPFGPTRRPTEPITTGQATGPDSQLDADTVLRLLYQVRPSPWLARLMRGV